MLVHFAADICRSSIEGSQAVAVVGVRFGSSAEGIDWGCPLAKPSMLLVRWTVDGLCLRVCNVQTLAKSQI